jgi:hypothetical protein
MNALEQKLVEWFERDLIRSRGWAARLFWYPAEDGSPYGAPKVDPRELEVLLATLLGEPSEFKDLLNSEQAGRGSFLAANARRHELPLLTRRAD